MQDRDLENKYSNYTDEELISMAREGNDTIPDYLMNKYKNLVKSKAKSMYIIGSDNEDLIQEGMIGLFKAIRDYDAGRDASFFTFAELCIVRQMYTAVTEAGRKKHSALNSSISLSYCDSDSGDVNGLQDRFPLSKNDDPEALFIDKENIEEIHNFIETELSKFERDAISLSLTGMSYSEIARVLSRDEKSTDNALQRAKAKIKKNFSNKL